jgi:hypothetical protein
MTDSVLEVGAIMYDRRQATAGCDTLAAGYAIWKLEAALKCSSGKKGRSAQPQCI